jgi:hypothetical protein
MVEDRSESSAIGDERAQLAHTHSLPGPVEHADRFS